MSNAIDNIFDTLGDNPLLAAGLMAGAAPLVAPAGLAGAAGGGVAAGLGEAALGDAVLGGGLASLAPAAPEVLGMGASGIFPSAALGETAMSAVIPGMEGALGMGVPMSAIESSLPMAASLGGGGFGGGMGALDALKYMNGGQDEQNQQVVMSGGGMGGYEKAAPFMNMAPQGTGMYQAQPTAGILDQLIRAGL